ncbi:MAG TPA: helix-turn-helix domain-containing protein [Ktedonobacteraceae bacterium]|jgi:hypothetical protein|nr:helix-turn-helix domain-containing protein [Ktedonobacteraceae bacterium]
MSARQLDQVGEYMTIREAARLKGATPNALYLWLKSRQVPCSKVGRTIVVRLVDIVSYTPRGK